MYLKNLQDLHYMELNRLKEEINRLYLEKEHLLNRIHLETTHINDGITNELGSDAVFYFVCGLVLVVLSSYLVIKIYPVFLASQNCFVVQSNLNCIADLARISHKDRIKVDELLSNAIDTINSNENLFRVLDLSELNSKVIALDIKILDLVDELEYLIAVFGPDILSPTLLSNIDNIKVVF
jgi:hypothetical protein